MKINFDIIKIHNAFVKVLTLKDMKNALNVMFPGFLNKNFKIMYLAWNAMDP